MCFSTNLVHFKKIYKLFKTNVHIEETIKQKQQTKKEKTKKPVAVKKIKAKPKVQLNNLGYPLDDPYGLAAAFWRAFG